MLSRRLATARSLRRVVQTPRPFLPAVTARCISQAELDDPDLNGGYVNPPREKRQFRDPYGDWWDKQERKNFNEPVHEDNDILGMLSPYEYTHFTAKKAWFLMGCFVATILGLTSTVRMLYPDKPAVERTFPDGLSAELGGPGALPAKSDEES